MWLISIFVNFVIKKKKKKKKIRNNVVLVMLFKYCENTYLLWPLGYESYQSELQKDLSENSYDLWALYIYIYLGTPKGKKKQFSH